MNRNLAIVSRPPLFNIITVTVVGCLLRLSWVAAFAPLPTSDATFYDSAAKQISLGGYPGAYLPPGFPILLGAFYNLLGYNLTVAHLVLVSIGTLCIALLYYLTRLWSSESVALVAAALLAVWPNHVAASGILRPDLLICAALLGMTYVISRFARYGGKNRILLWLAGFLLAVGILSKPTFVLAFIPVALSGFGICRCSVRKWALNMAFVGIVTGGTLVPWIIWASNQEGGFVPVSLNGGDNLYIGNSPGATGGYIAIDVPENMSTLDRNRWFTDEAIAFIREHPARFFSQIPVKVINTWDREVSFISETFPRAVETDMMSSETLGLVFRFVSQLLYIVTMICAVIGLIHAIKSSGDLRQIAIIPLGIGFLITITSIVYFGHARFHFFFLPLFFPFAVTGASIAMRSQFGRKREILYGQDA